MCWEDWKGGTILSFKEKGTQDKSSPTAFLSKKVVIKSRGTCTNGGENNPCID